MEKIKYEMELIDPNRIRVEVYFQLSEDVKELLGILYYEKAKRGFNRKPVGMNAWACVDAKVEGLYTKDESITPKHIMDHIQGLIREAGY